MAVFREADQRIQAANEAWRQFWGVAADPVDGLRADELLTDEQARLHCQWLNTVRKSGQPETWPEVAVSVRRDGQAVRRYVSVVASPMPAAVHQPGGIGMVITDITETVLARQRAEEAAREQQTQRRMMQEALDNSPVSIVITSSIRDPKTGQIVDFAYRLANREANRLSNLPPEGVLPGQTLLTAFPGDLESGIFGQFRRVVETGEPMAVETHYQHGGVNQWFYIRAARHGDGFVQTTLDITPVKEAEAAIRQQTELLRTILDNSQTAISLHNAVRDGSGCISDFRTILANRQAYTIWGSMAEQVMNQTFNELLIDADSRLDFERYVRVVETGEPAQFDFGLNNRLYSINIARAGDGVVLSSVDITSDRQYRQQLEQINAELERSNESLQAFAYIASHDLQEPLRKLVSFSSILNSRYAGQIDAGGQDILVRMQLAAARMSDLIRDLLAYARIGNQSESSVLVDVAELLSDLIDDMDDTIETAGATVQLGALPQLPGNPMLLRQLFQNLLSNALKFRREGIAPVVQISSERLAGSQLPEPPADPSCAYWALRVADNGIGFDEKYAERIFQVFQRLHGRSQYSGTGIGLAIVRKVAAHHGGRVGVESRVGEGTTFTVYLPE